MRGGVVVAALEDARREPHAGSRANAPENNADVRRGARVTRDRTSPPLAMQSQTPLLDCLEEWAPFGNFIHFKVFPHGVLPSTACTKVFVSKALVRGGPHAFFAL